MIVLRWLGWRTSRFGLFMVCFKCCCLWTLGEVLFVVSGLFGILHDSSWIDLQWVGYLNVIRFV